jgi:hypothetical protein
MKRRKRQECPIKRSFAGCNCRSSTKRTARRGGLRLVKPQLDYSKLRVPPCRHCSKCWSILNHRPPQEFGQRTALLVTPKKRDGGYRSAGAGVGSSRESTEAMSDSNRLKHCEREIAEALAASRRERPLNERLGILLWEMDWRAERQSLVEKGEERVCWEPRHPK